MAKRPAIAVINAGSSSLKFSLFEADEAEPAFLKGSIDEIDGSNPRLVIGHGKDAEKSSHSWSAPLGHECAMRYLLEFIGEHLEGHEVTAVGHRIVHGGTAFARPVRLDPGILDRLEQLTPLAPLHQPHNIAPARAIACLVPSLLQVGCFDTSFHVAQPHVAQAFALPTKITERGVRRYGFHGISYEYIVSKLRELAPELVAGKLIVAHLGNGASLCAIADGRSVASTMGFTAVDGLPMGTRCGALDPGVLLYLMDEMKMGAREIERLIYKESGLIGVSGVSSDLRVLEQSDAPGARAAIELFVYRIAREIGSLAAALGGLDGLVFTAGIGEHSAAVREAVCRQAAWLGVKLDAAANAAGAETISAVASPVAVRVVPTDEERMIANHTRDLLQDSRQS